MKMALSAIAATAALMAGVALAQSGSEVLKARGCLNCHEADKKKIGPAFKDVAAKYKNDKGAESRLIGMLKDGQGHPKIAGSDAELKAAVGQVLSTK